jgi:hypothetical protein
MDQQKFGSQVSQRATGEVVVLDVAADRLGQGHDQLGHVLGIRLAHQRASGGGNVPGMLVPLAVSAGSGNPVGLSVGGTVKAHGEMTGSGTIEGAAKETADKIMEQMRPIIERQGWI